MRAKMVLFLVSGLSRLPLQVAHALGTLLGWGFYLLPNRERHNARVNVTLCLPELSPKERSRVVRASLVEGVKTLTEMPGIWRADPQRWIAAIHPGEGMALPAQLLGKGNGLIVLAPHLGCWEAGLHYLTTLAPVTALYRPPRNPLLERFMLEGRRKGGATLVPTTGAGVKALYQALQRNELVAILPDQQPKQTGDKGGVFAPFFGTPALTMLLINRLVRKTGASIVYAYVERLPRGRGYRLNFLPAPEGIGGVDTVSAASALNLGVERCVRRCLTQYQWSYKRFGVRPDGEPSLYRRA